MSSEVKSNGQDPETKNPVSKSSENSLSSSSTATTATESNAQSGGSATMTTSSTSSSLLTTSKPSANNNQSSANNSSVSGSSNGGKGVKSEKLPESVEVKTEPPTASSTKVERPPPRNEPHVEPVNGIVHPPVIPPASRPGRVTNQLMYLKNNIIKGTTTAFFVCILVVQGAS